MLSQDFKDAIRRNNMSYQLATAHYHRRNIAEKAIQTFKHHFIAILCGTDETFPMHLWCRLLEQAEHTLNMLRPSRITPKVSAYAYLYGMHSYNANETVFFKCKYLTQPAITTSYALIKVADDLSKAGKGVIPQKGATMKALEQLVDIFKQQVKDKDDRVTRQRVYNENALP